MTWTRALVGSFLSWTLIFLTLTFYVIGWLVASALRLVVGQR